MPLNRSATAGTGKTVWYVLTGTSDPEIASLIGLNFSVKLNFAANGARSATFNADGFRMKRANRNLG